MNVKKDSIVNHPETVSKITIELNRNMFKIEVSNNYSFNISTILIQRFEIVKKLNILGIINGTMRNVQYR